MTVGTALQIEREETCMTLEFATRGLVSPEGEALEWTDLFSGGGGSTEGLVRAGHRVRFCCNHWPTAVDTHQKNNPDTEHLIANLSETDFRVFPRTRALWASPSCVWHAKSGGRKQPPAEIERLQLDQGAADRATAFAVVGAVEVHRYEAVVVENVPEFTGWSLFPWWLSAFEAMGYEYQSAIIDAAKVPGGVPQYRPRWFGVFTRVGGVDLSIPPVEVAPVATDILEDKPLKPITRRMYITPQVEQITEPNTLHLVTYRNHARALRADRHPLATVTAGGNHHAIASIDESGSAYQRPLTRLEKARAQGFPDTYQWCGTSDDIRRQIGNAVAVPVAQFLGARIGARLAAA
ncbi:DNA cytosine methyltransferase [Nocardia nova]